MDILTIVFKAVIVGGLGGFFVGAGTFRMFHAPNVQGMGSFRTLGEMNACEGDAVSHFLLVSDSFSTVGIHYQCRHLLKTYCAGDFS